MNKTKLMILLKDLQNTKEGSPELSCQCLLVIGWQKSSHSSAGYDYWLKPGFIVPDKPTFDGWKDLVNLGNAIGCFPGHIPMELPDPTCSIDDALDWMVPEGWHLQDMRTADPTEPGSIKCHARLMYHNTNDEGRMVGSIPNAQGATLSLAITAARIKLELDKLDD